MSVHDAAARPGEAKSPCVHDCRLDRAGETCLGCLRTIDEIIGWRAMDHRARQAVLDRIADEADGSSAARAS